MKKQIDIRAQGERKAEVLIYDVIGEDFFGGGISAKGFAENLKALGELDEINVRINSPGGNAFDGMTIFNTLARHPAKVIVDIDGLAASAATLIAMAGDTIRIAGNALMMIHNAQGIAMGDQNEMLKMADLLDKMDGQIADLYAKRTGRKADTFRNMMGEETWFTAQEAIDNKLADELTPAKRVAACFDLSQFGYRKAPELRNEVEEQEAAAEPETPEPVQNDGEAVAVKLRLLELEEANG